MLCRCLLYSRSVTVRLTSQQGGLQHLLVLKPPFTPPPATPRAVESLVPGVQALCHSRR
nr:MAG TPA: hypothetical protein [Caudoviricetes sp.]